MNKGVHLLALLANSGRTLRHRGRPAQLLGANCVPDFERQRFAFISERIPPRAPADLLCRQPMIQNLVILLSHEMLDWKKTNREKKKKKHRGSRCCCVHTATKKDVGTAHTFSNVWAN